MKKLFFLCSFFLLAGVVSLSAQSAKSCAKKCSKTAAKSCSKAAAKNCMKTASLKALEGMDERAVALAEADESINIKQCSKSGKVSIMKSYTCEKSGKLVEKEVLFDAESNAFIDAKQTAAKIEKTPMATH